MLRNQWTACSGIRGRYAPDFADIAYAKEAVLRLAMLLAAVGLAFTAYASLLNEDNNLRPIFAFLALVMLLINLSQFWAAFFL